MIEDICKKVDDIINISELTELIQLCEETTIQARSIILSAFRDNVLRTLNQRKRMLEKTNAPIWMSNAAQPARTQESRKLWLRDYWNGIYHAWEQFFFPKK